MRPRARGPGGTTLAAACRRGLPRLLVALLKKYAQKMLEIDVVTCYVIGS